MKRLVVGLLLCLAPPALAKEKLPLEPLTYKSPAGQSLNYQLMKPAKPEGQQKYPLVIFLHGAGERGSDNVAQLKHGVPQFASDENRAKYPCFLIAPQCPEGKKWVEVDWSSDKHDSPKEPSDAAGLTLQLVDAMLKEFPIDPKRIYLTGLSMGGYGTWDLLARRPDFFAAGVPVCGGADEKTAEKLKSIPLWVFHGAKDTAVKPERSRRMVEALQKVGSKVKYTEYPEVGHDSWNPAYRDPELMKWLFEQKRK